MSVTRLHDVLMVLLACAIAALATNEFVRTAAIFAAGWNASWAIQGEER